MIAVLGCGNMSQAIVRGIYENDKNESFLTYTPSQTKALSLANLVGGKAITSLCDLAKADEILIACKPQQFKNLSSELNKVSNIKDKHFISIMAAINIETIKKELNVSNVTRVMPNTPIFLGKGISLILHSEDLAEENKNRVESLFQKISRVLVLENEEQFDKVTTITGSGPAYVFYLMNLLKNELISSGVSTQKSKDLIIDLFSGSAALIEGQPDLCLEEMISQVTSKGGVTIEAIKHFDDSNMSQIFSEALFKAYNRSRALSQSFD